MLTLSIPRSNFCSRATVEAQVIMLTPATMACLFKLLPSKYKQTPRLVDLRNHHVMRNTHLPDERDIRWRIVAVARLTHTQDQETRLTYASLAAEHSYAERYFVNFVNFWENLQLLIAVMQACLRQMASHCFCHKMRSNAIIVDKNEAPLRRFLKQIYRPLWSSISYRHHCALVAL